MAPYYPPIYVSLCVQCMSFCAILQNVGRVDQFTWKYQISNFTKYHPAVCDEFHWCGRTDRYNKLITRFLQLLCDTTLKRFLWRRKVRGLCLCLVAGIRQTPCESIIHELDGQMTAEMWWSSRLRRCAKNPKVAGSIPNGVIGNFYCINSSGRNRSLMSNINGYEGYLVVGKDSRCLGLTTLPPSLPTV